MRTLEKRASRTTSENAPSRGVGNVPEAKLRVRRSRDELVLPDELDVGDGFAVALEDGGRALRLPDVVEMDGVVGGAEGQLVAVRDGLAELDAADVHPETDLRHRPLHSGLPQFHLRRHFLPPSTEPSKLLIGRAR